MIGRRGKAALAAATVVAWVAVCAAQPLDNAGLFRRGVESLEAGDYDKAVDAFEALADRGEASPAAAYDRGLAYLARVRGKSERPGDLGRAAAAFEEALLVDPDDTEAEHAVELVRAEVARRRARRAAGEVQARPSLDRIVVGLVPEQAWAWSAIVASWVLTAGLVLRKAPRGPCHLAGLIATPVGLVALLVFAPLAGYARHLRRTVHPAVVVALEAPMLDANGAATGRDPVPEASRVEVHERRGELIRIRYGSSEGWTHATSVRLLRTNW